MDVKEKLVELLNNSFAKQYERRGLLTAPHTATDLISNGVTVQEWISVKDRLPDVNTNKSGYERKGVIVCVDGCSTKSVYRVYERACNRGKTVYRWKYPWDTISDENITHWCELPQPPKGE